MAIRVNTPVKVIDGHYADKTGKVIEVFETLGTAIVSFDDNGDVGKVSMSALIEIQDQKKPVEPEIPEGAKKISRADYLEALSEITSPEKMDVGSMGKFIAAMSTMIVGRRICDEVFKDCDVVVMTEADFIAALWDACSPAKIAEYGKHDKSDRGVLHVSITTMIGLEKIVGILFGDEVGK